MLDVTEHKRVEAQLRQSLEMLRRTMDERRALLERLEAAQEEERRRIAAGIHDESVQTITAADLRVQALRLAVDSVELAEELDEVHAMLRDAVGGLRQLLFELRPPVLDHEGLGATIRQYLEAEERPASVLRDALGSEPPPELRAVLFRIAQEAVTNARKHANASTIEVTVASEDGGIRMRIADDGAGFEASTVAEPPRPGHIGLPTLFERAEMVGGRCTVQTAPGRGTVVDCWVPVPS
jgi:signal transduction histidine kinase